MSIPYDLNFLLITKIVIGTTLARFCPFPANPYLLYLVQSKFCKEAVRGSGQPLSCKGGGYYFIQKDPQDPGQRQGGGQLLQRTDLYFHSGAADRLYHQPVLHNLHEAGA